MTRPACVLRRRPPHDSRTISDTGRLSLSLRIVVFLLLQRYYIRGLTAGAIRG